MSWDRKTLKKNAKATLQKNRMNIIIVCFIIAIVAGGYSVSTMGLQIDSNDLDAAVPATISGEVSRTVRNLQQVLYGTEEALTKIEDKFTLRGATEGAIATVLNNSAGSRSFLIGILNLINQFVFDSRFLEGTVIAIATAILFLFWLFVQNNLLVGECRFFLETKHYPNSNAKRLLFPYRIGQIFHIAGIMFFRALYTVLWSLTIVGGFIKYYSYRMIPYLLAENPTITRKEAFQLSNQMMKGNKWRAFTLDMSFFFWQLLSILTLGIVGFVYVNPYLSATRSELYFALRQQALEEKQPLAVKYLMDDALIFPVEDTDGLYPTEDYLLPEVRGSEWTTLRYDRDYSLLSLAFIFFGTAFIGWVWEVFLYLFKTGRFINRGTLIGPWLPIYGVGSLLIIILLKPLIKKPSAFFVSSFIVCGLLEYFTSWALETLFHQSWWDYSKVFFNINGRVSLEGLLFFATGGSLVAYVLAPTIDDLVSRIPKKMQYLVIAVLLAFFSLDVVTGFSNPNQGEGITTSQDASPQGKYVIQDSLSAESAHHRKALWQRLSFDTIV